MEGRADEELLLRLTVEHLLARGEWPTLQYLHRRIYQGLRHKIDVLAVASRLAPHPLLGGYHNLKDKFVPSLVVLGSIPESEILLDTVVDVVRYAVERYLSGETIIRNTDLGQHIEPGASTPLKVLLETLPFFQEGGGSNDEGWYFNISDYIVNWDDLKSRDDFLFRLEQIENQRSRDYAALRSAQHRMAVGGEAWAQPQVAQLGASPTSEMSEAKPPDEEYDFDVALSFAGEDRGFVKPIRDQLIARDIRTFYDEDHSVDMWGEDLGEYLDAVYRKRSRYAVIFVSRHYVEKAWPSHERKSALARAIESRIAYVLPVRLDKTEAPGLRPTTGYIDATLVGPDGVVAAIEQKLGRGGASAPSGSVDRTPRNQAELDRLVTILPPGWEYLLYAGTLHVELLNLESKYRDHELEYAPRSNRSLDKDGAIAYLQGALAEISRIVGQTESVMDPGLQERAFGKPGEPGDPELIRHSAQRLISIYQDLLEWSADVRATAVPDEFRPVLRLVARFASQPAQEFRNFVSQTVAATDRLPAYLALPEPKELLEITLELVLTADEDVLAEFHREMKRLKRRGRWS